MSQIQSCDGENPAHILPRGGRTQPPAPSWGGGRELALMDLRGFVLELELVCKAALTYLSAHVAFSVSWGTSDEGVEPCDSVKPEQLRVSLACFAPWALTCLTVALGLSFLARHSSCLLLFFKEVWKVYRTYILPFEPFGSM